MDEMSEKPDETLNDAQASLRATVMAFSGQRFAVVDGGHFEDLPARLRRERLFARSLFLDQADIEVQKAGPWLISLDQAPETIDGVFAIVGDKPAAVFWCCGAGEAVLYRHLRTINMARIPAWAAEGKEAQGPSDELDAYQPVFFRHFDPRVLGALMPCLDAAQFARILGPAEEIAFDCPDYGALKRVILDPSWPSAAPGYLSLDTVQIKSLTERRLTNSRSKILLHIRAVGGSIFDQYSNQDLLKLIFDSGELSKALHVTREDEMAKIAYLYILLKSHIPRHV